MKYKINSADGRLINVTFTYDDGTVITKKLDLQPIGYDALDGEGKPIVLKYDPIDDVEKHLSDYMIAYERGRAISEREVPSNLIGKTTTVVMPVVEADPMEGIVEPSA